MFIYDFNFDCGRQGSLSGLFVVDQRGKDLLMALVDSKRIVYFGEALGKHSEIAGRIDPGDVTERPIERDAVTHVASIMGWTIQGDGAPWHTISGFNPLAEFDFDAYDDADQWDNARAIAVVRGEVSR